MEHHPLVVPAHEPLGVLEEVVLREARLPGHQTAIWLWNFRKTVCSWETMRFTSLRGSPMSAQRVVRCRASLRGMLRGRSRRGSRVGAAAEQERSARSAAAAGAARSAVAIEVGLVGRAAPVERVEIEARGAEVVQRVGVVLALQARHRVEGQVVVDELAEVGVAGRDRRVLVVVLLALRLLPLARLDHLARQRLEVAIRVVEDRQVAEHASEASLAEGGARHDVETADGRAVMARVHRRRRWVRDDLAGAVGRVRGAGLTAKEVTPSR